MPFLITSITCKGREASYTFRITGNHDTGFVGVCELPNGGPVASGRSIQSLAEDIKDSVETWESITK